MSDSDPRDGFFHLLLTPMIDPYITSQQIVSLLSGSFLFVLLNRLELHQWIRVRFRASKTGLIPQ